MRSFGRDSARQEDQDKVATKYAMQGDYKTAKPRGYTTYDTVAG